MRAYAVFHPDTPLSAEEVDKKEAAIAAADREAWARDAAIRSAQKEADAQLPRLAEPRCEACDRPVSRCVCWR